MAIPDWTLFPDERIDGDRVQVVIVRGTKWPQFDEPSL
jgi:hypothetical protein